VATSHACGCLLPLRGRWKRLYENPAISFRSAHFVVSFTLWPKYRLSMTSGTVFYHLTVCSGAPGMMLTPSHKKNWKIEWREERRFPYPGDEGGALQGAGLRV
jgi:hypothetical protein